MGTGAGTVTTICRKLRLSHAAIAVFLLLPPTASAQSSAASDSRIEEIVVHARKRDELIGDTPISVTAISANNLRDTNITRLDQVADLVPNMVFSIGRNTQSAQVRIRGVGTASGEQVFDSGVGTYVDGIFLSRAQGQLLDIVDIQQIEVLRGPQGTLFGKNTTGGAVSITTVKPTQDFAGTIVLRPGNRDSFDARATLNAPLYLGDFMEDRILTRFAVSLQERRGYTRNTTRDEWHSDQHAFTFLGSLRLLLSDDLTLDASGTWSRNHNRGAGGECLVVNDNVDDDIAESCNGQQPFRFEANEFEVSDLISTGGWGTVSWDAPTLGPFENTIKLLGSWREQTFRNREDLDNTAVQVIALSTAGDAGSPQKPRVSRQGSTELQFNSSGFDGVVNLVGGAFGFWESSDQTAQTLVSGTAFQSARTRTDNWNWALYSQATVDPVEWLSLTAGIRFTEEKKGVQRIERNSDGELNPENPPPARETFSEWTPMGSIALRIPDAWLADAPLDEGMAYFTYSRGFKGGGFNATAGSSGTLEPFDQENIEAFEVGVKTAAFGHRMRLSAALFHNNYDDIQVTSLRNVGDPDGDGMDNLERMTLNAADAETRGAELEIQLLPIEGLAMNGSVGLLDTEYKEFLSFDGITNQPRDRTGESFNRAPELQTHLGIQYGIDLDQFGPECLHGRITPRIDWIYQSEFQLVGPEVEQLHQSGFNLLHARLSYDFLDDSAQVALWGRNLTDEEYIANGVAALVSTFGILTRYYAPPRTWGAEITYRF